MKEPVEVEILGQRLTVASDDGPVHVREVARLVDEQLRRLSDAHRSVSSVHLALLAALNMGSELSKLRGEIDRVNERLRKLSELVEAGLCP
jgi:cell division protein ZapA